MFFVLLRAVATVLVSNFMVKVRTKVHVQEMLLDLAISAKGHPDHSTAHIPVPYSAPLQVLMSRPRSA
jgi:hypothetical protein